MKKLLTILFVGCTFFLTPLAGFNEAKADTTLTGSALALNFNDTSATTKRIHIKSSMNIVLKNWGTKDTRYTIFKYGVAVLSGRVDAGKHYTNTKLSLDPGDYSVRVYCGIYGSNTGCNATGQIKAN